MSKENVNTSVEELLLSAKYVAPEVIEDKFKGYVLNGKNNEYFTYVDNRRMGSPTHSAIVSSRSVSDQA